MGGVLDQQQGQDFLVPVVAVIAKHGTFLGLVRLWAVTLVMNLAGGWVVLGLVMAGFPAIRATAVEAANSYVGLGITWSAFALAIKAACSSR